MHSCNEVAVLIILHLQVLYPPLIYGVLNRTNGLDRILTFTSRLNQTHILHYLVEQRLLLKEG